MIDMHSHILPNIDDGAKNMEQTKALMEEALKVGFNGIVLTSHYLEGSYEKSIEERKTLIADAQKLENIPLYIGNEVYISENIVKLFQEEKIASINNTQYILFELPFHTKPMNLYEIVYEMIQHKLIPILAHPERYNFIWKEPELIEELIQKGVLMQCNYGSIIGQYGKKPQIIVKKLLQNNMVHFLGTDAHKPETVYPKMPEILQELRKLIGEEQLEQLSQTNPEKVLNGEKIIALKPSTWKYTLKEKWIMNQN